PVERELAGALLVVGVDRVEVAGLHSPPAGDPVLDQLEARPPLEHLAHDRVVGLHLDGEVVEIERLDVVRDRDRRRDRHDDVVIGIAQLDRDRVIERLNRFIPHAGWCRGETSTTTDPPPSPWAMTVMFVGAFDGNESKIQLSTEAMRFARVWTVSAKWFGRVSIFSHSPS